MKSLLSFFAIILFALSAQGQCNPSFAYAAAPTQSTSLNWAFTNTTVSSVGPGGTLQMNLNYGDGSYDQLSGWAWTMDHVYAATGTYNVKLTMYRHDSITNSTCIDSVIHTITVTLPACFSTFTSVKNPANNGQVTFTANNPASTPGMVYTWDFGDGNTGTGSPITHTYANSAATYNVTLVATAGAPANCSFTTSHPVYNIINGCNGHTAAFSINQPSQAPTYVYLYDQTPTFGQWYSLSYDYGDGTSGTSSQHIYSALGTYTITLTYNWLDSPSNSILCSSTASQSVTVSQFPNSDLGGYITKDSNSVPTGVDTYKVWLIQYNSSTSLLTAVDSIIVFGMNTWQPYTFHNVFTGNYLVKAKLISGPTSGSGPVPTYHFSSLYWGTAISVVHTAPGSTYGVDIAMQTGTITNGPGFIGGNVNMGANKGTGGAAVPGMEIILRNASNAPIAYAYTDANGNYSFSNLPLGTYSIYPEEMNYITTPYTSVQLTSASPSKSGYVFGVVNNEIRPKTTDVAVIPGNDGLSIHPNPSNGKCYINWTNVNTDYSIVVTDIAGNLVYKGAGKPGANAQELDLQNLQTGMYFIRLESGDANVTQKLIIQH